MFEALNGARYICRLQIPEECPTPAFAVIAGHQDQPVVVPAKGEIHVLGAPLEFRDGSGLTFFVNSPKLNSARRFVK